MENKELRDLLTHVNGSTNSHETRKLDQEVVIEPAHSNPSEYDTHTGKFKSNVPSNKS